MSPDVDSEWISDLISDLISPLSSEERELVIPRCASAAMAGETPWETLDPAALLRPGCEEQPPPPALPSLTPSSEEPDTRSGAGRAPLSSLLPWRLPLTWPVRLAVPPPAATLDLLHRAAPPRHHLQ